MRESSTMLYITRHVRITGRGSIRYKICARDARHVWVRMVGRDSDDLERVTINQVEVIQ